MSYGRQIRKLSKFVTEYAEGRLPERRADQRFIDRAFRSIAGYYGLTGTAAALRRRLSAAQKDIRPYAAFWKWTRRDKAVEELAVAKALVASVGGPPLEFSTLRTQFPDPPDVVGERASGQLAAIELAELVDEKAIAMSLAAQRKGRPDQVVHRYWDAPTLVAAVDRLLREKDAKTLQGGPYAEYFVVLYTDEVFLRREDVAQWLGAHVFSGVTQATNAYLLLSFDPDIDGYPFVKLSLTR